MATTPDNVAIAKRQLGLADYVDVSAIPRAYLEELAGLRKLYPHDTKFRVIAAPMQGYGKVHCEEASCNIDIPLDRNNKFPDGGEAFGIGGLNAYTRHITRFSPHTVQRNARVRSARAASTTPLKRESSEDVSKYPLLAARHRFMATPAKPEPVESTVPRKRSKDVAIAGPSRLADSPPAPKRLKPESTLTRPLAVANRDQQMDNLPTVDELEDRRLQRLDLQKELGDAKRHRDRIVQKRHQTKRDLTRLARFENAIATLEASSKELRDGIPTLSRTPTRSLASRQRTSSCPTIDHLLKRESSLLGPFTIKAEPSSSGRLVPSVVNNIFAGAGALFSDIGRGLPGLPGVVGINSDDGDDTIDLDPVNPDAIVNRMVGTYIPTVAPAANADAYDDNGDYHGRGRDTYRGPVARTDDIDKFLLAAGNAEAFDENVGVKDCLRKLGLPNMTALLPGLEVPLMPHQVIGVSWMVEKEADKNYMGGILGDDMGLGKTVEMIAVIMKNRSRDGACKTSLIITPKALLGQWKIEIELKTNDGLRCLIYHGTGKVKRKSDLLGYDVVLTTFQTMSAEWPDYEMEMKKKEKAARKKGNSSDDFIVSDSDDEDRDAKKGKKKEKGLLFLVDFYRIVLDEGHYIRNRRVRTSRAVSELNSKYRWVLTGTPIINSLTDVYGYFRFLRLRPWHDWSKFNVHIGSLEKKNPALAMTRLQAIFRACLMRRMKDSKLDGKNLLDLPPKNIELVKLDFMQEERDIYQMVEAASQAKFNRYLKAGTVLKNFSQVLVLLLRLRQICSHPALVQENGTTFISSEEHEDSWNPKVREELIRAREAVSSEFVAKMKRILKEAALKRIEAEKESVDAVAEIEECDICMDTLSSAAVTPCCHTFCRECIDSYLDSPSHQSEDASPDQPQYKANERGCPMCRQPIRRDVLFNRAIFEPSDTELYPKETTVVFKPKKRAKDKGKARVAAVDSDAEDSGKGEEIDEDETMSTDGEDEAVSDFIVDDHDDNDYHARPSKKPSASKKSVSSSRKKPFVVLDSDDEEDEAEVKEVVFGKKKKDANIEPTKLHFKFLASTKMKHMMDQLLKMFEDKPDEKVIIVSQWTSCLDLVSQYLQDKEITHVKFQGDMTSNKRETAVRVFMSRDKERVMLLSLKCGGVGLNLTRANNVISLDLGWSQAVEAQAYDRVHRLGQNRPVKVERLVIKDTVEDRILALQERKQNLADGSLGEGSGKKIGRLSVKELVTYLD